MRLGLSRGLRLGVLMVAATGAVLFAQTPAVPGATKNDAEVQKEGLQAEALYQQQNYLAALPLFEDLHQQRPESNVFRERLAMCLLAKMSTEAPSDATLTRERAKKLLLEAKAAGDNSDLLQIMLERLSTPFAGATGIQKSPGAELMLKAEKAFSNGKLKKALELYKKASESDPKLYEAALFAGNTEFKRKNYDEACGWFAKAIAINPDRETAYRYWGDTLVHSGKQKAAQSKFVDAVIAEPYTKPSWEGLQQWANASHAQLASPPITLPKQAVVDAKGNVNVDASTTGSPTSGVWLVYSTQSMMWRSTEFKKHYPNEPVYRHSLAEEAEGLRSVIAVVKEQNIPEDKLDPTLKSLLALEKDGMLECWILLNGADQGIVQDYAAYRATHRGLLHAYLDKYVIHFNQPS